MKRSVLITGGAGFIGSNIARELLRQDYKVTILDNLSTGRLENLNDIWTNVHFIRGDIQSLDVVQKAIRGVGYVLHQAALPSVPRSINNPLASHNANVNGTFNVLLAARDNKVKKVVLASSSSIYGNRKSIGIQKVVNKKEVMKPMPLSPYAVNKLIGEEYAKVFAHIYKVPTVCLRYFNVFGPYQDPNSQYAAVIPKFISLLMRGVQPTIFGDGSQSRDFTYIENVVHANILAMHSKRAIHGETLNIGCGRSTTLLQVTRTIAKTLGRKAKPKFGPNRAGDVKSSLADISKAKKYIGYTPIVLLDEGLKHTLAWYRTHRNR